jgi:polar amino acid transport system substrate-binding protein
VSARRGLDWRPWLRVLLLMLATSVLVLGTVAADAVPGQPPIRAVGPASTVGTASVAGQASAAACNPKASSLRPSGPPQVTSGSFMGKIRARGFLIAGVDQSTNHFGFLNPLDGKIEGFDIDMIRAVTQAIFGNPERVKYKAISDAQRIPDTVSGAVDIVAHTMTITCARLQQVDFSSVYFDAAQRVLVLLQQGDVAAISTDDSILVGLTAQDPWTKLVGPRLTDEPYGLAISKQHPDFVAFVNAVLQQVRTNGQWAASYAHWVGTPVPAPPPAQYGG